MYEGDSEKSITAKGVKFVNLIRAMMYFLVAGVQFVYCTTEALSCGIMIVLVPLTLGVLDSLLIWQSGRDTMVVRIAALTLSVVSLTVAIDTLAPIYHGPGLINDHLFFMFFLSFGVIIMSTLEFIIVVFDLASGKEELEDLRISTSTRTY
ncbi:MAG: hypothetical protein ACFFFK_05750 [Candidatus Thorarchaeota archaeon]